MLRRLAALPLFLVTATGALAQEGEAICRNGLFPSEPPFALAEVSGADRVYFHRDMEGCPQGEGCRTGAYVVPGDTVVISRLRRGFACAFYPGRGGGTAGWVRIAPLRLLPVEANPPLSAWIGGWSSGGNPAIRFWEELGALHVVGEAYWPGPPGSHDWPSTHQGEIAGPVERAGHRASYTDDALCEVNFTLLGDYLIAGSNRNCGGANVSFSAVYRREAE